MTTNYALYTAKRDHLPHEIMQQLADDISPTIGMTERGQTFTYCWPDLTVIVAEMEQDQIADHLKGFEGYIRAGIYRDNVPPRGEEIIRHIRQFTMVIGIEAHPGIDDDGRAEELIGRMCGGLRPIMFHCDALFDWMGRLLLGPDQSYDPDAEADGG